MLALALALILAGCNATPTPVVPKLPHGGSLFTAPDGKNVVEIVQQESSSPGKVQFTAYFLDEAMKPLAPLPTAAKFQPKAPRGAPAVELKPSGDADPANASAMATPPMAAEGGINGEITAMIDGKTVVFTINVR